MIAPYSDLPLDNGDLNPYSSLYLDGIDLVLQAVPIALQIGLGEWGLDTTYGLPYIAWAQQKPAPLNQISVLMRAQVVGVAGIKSVTSLTVQQVGRDIFVDITVVLFSGESATGSGVVPGIGPSSSPWAWFLIAGSH